ncbi:lectin-domain containing receptor kinase VI.3-like [Carica papaya]|uniref:lectin-domain containing receptor kinase VI.3-like n=1 Tax=Carica papaya TaxID=3649 RepID=UPI000B8C789F|nr:lectin-domain containing receptor kinase VI.3-like [Carica papaya]
MDLTNSLASFIIIIIATVFFFSGVVQGQNTSFIFSGFNGSEANITMDGAATIIAGGALRLTGKSHHAIGHAFYREPIRMFDESSSSSNEDVYSFSTNFVFVIKSPSSGRGGYGFAFTLAPKTQFSDAEAGHFLGLFNRDNDNKTSNHVFAVEFDTVNGFNETTDSQGNHVGLNVNSVDSIEQEPAGYDTPVRNEDLDLEIGEPIHAWIEYDGVNKVVNVTIWPANKERPIRPLISKSLDLVDIVKEFMYVGFSASTGKESSSHYLLGWSFSTNKMANFLHLSTLPSAPNEKEKSSKKTQVAALIGALSAVSVILMVVLACLVLHRRRMQAENLEDWELDCPHRFRYKDLDKATKGFKESEMIGVGGFGTVYKGVLPTSGIQIAVKKISRNSIQGLREFAAEIESLGRLRHKNLVNLQGWCKHKNDLLLIYDYVPNGSLDSLLFRPKKGCVLKWDERVSIAKGVAEGLLYLHEEWEQVVIHRDVKSSNVLIDGEMNARLGDFGLARLYDHGTSSHTTNIVGTVGYIAPELARNGKASASSDVFAYGVLLLEIVSGRKPTAKNNFFLVDWVAECFQMGKILEAVDPNLNSDYVVEEVKLMMGLGLLCCHRKDECRPSMRQVLRYLNGDDELPLMDFRCYLDSDEEERSSRVFLQVVSYDTVTRSIRSSSTGGISFSSVDTGRC